MIDNRDFEVKWGYPCEELFPSGDGCILEVEVMTIRGSIDIEQLLQRYAAGERDFSYLNIEESDELSGVNLSEINLSNSSVGEVFMAESNLSGANLRGTQFGQTCLRNTNLQNADLTSADLRHANLDGADLTGANLTDTILQNITMLGANLTDSNLTNAEVDITPESFKNCIFRRTVMPDGQIYTGTIESAIDSP